MKYNCNVGGLVYRSFSEECRVA